jgi:hypothetical protein
MVAVRVSALASSDGGMIKIGPEDHRGNLRGKEAAIVKPASELRPKGG